VNDTGSNPEGTGFGGGAGTTVGGGTLAVVVGIVVIGGLAVFDPHPAATSTSRATTAYRTRHS
jgi:hypothetical protein